MYSCELGWLHEDIHERVHRRAADPYLKGVPDPYDGVFLFTPGSLPALSQRAWRRKLGGTFSGALRGSRC